MFLSLSSVRGGETTTTTTTTTTMSSSSFQQHGFVQSVFNEISLEKDPDLWQNADSGLTERRISFLSGLEATSFRRYLDKGIHVLKKNCQLSGAFREKGNCLYKNGDYNASLSVYNQALCLAPKDADVYAITLANRSAVWYALRKYKNAISDIQRSLRSSYPDRLRFKLLERKAKCEIGLGLEDSSSETISEFIQCVSESDLKQALKDKKIEAIHREFEKAFSYEDEEKQPEIKKEETEKESVQDEDRVIGFKDSVSIGKSKDRGRFTYANRDIQPGEMIAVDEPFVKHLDKEHIKTHCWHCLGRAPIPIPCDDCSGVIYCSDTCCQASYSYHRFECGLTDILQQGGVGTWILAYRALSSRRFSYWTGLDEIHRDESLTLFNGLETHEHSDGYNAPALMKEALTVVFFIRCLNLAGYFPSRRLSGTLSSDEMVIAMKIQRFMRIASFNSHEVTEVILRNSAVSVVNYNNGGSHINNECVDVRRVGTSINPHLALINHSCDPNYGRVWNARKGTITGFATRLIRQGDEIVDAYSAIFSYRNKKERSSVHKRYNFTCSCRPCLENWPLLPQLDQDIKVKSSAKLSDKVKRLKSLCTSIEARPTVQNCAAFMTLASEVLKPPHAMLVAVEDKLHKCLLKTHGI